jgi:predicted  nucleic acid-binding Zn-ribbon protein
MTIFGFSITKKSRLATKEDIAALIASFGELETDLNALKAEIEPIKAFMQEHSKNILEAEEEYNRQQRAISEGIQSIANYNLSTAMKKGDK